MKKSMMCASASYREPVKNFSENEEGSRVSLRNHIETEAAMKLWERGCLKATPASFPEKHYELYPIYMKFLDDGAIKIRHAYTACIIICNVALQEGHGNQQLLSLTPHMLEAKLSLFNQALVLHTDLF